MRFPEHALWLVPALLAAQAFVVHGLANTERPPRPPDLSRFPAQFAGWRKVSDNQIAPDVEAQLRADRLLSRVYARESNGSVADLFVAWYESQRGGATQPHSPKVCLPGSGWTPQTNDTIQLQVGAESITANRYVVVNGISRAVVLYWYQTPRRITAGELAAKLWTVYDGVRDRRTDTALVRVVVWSAPGRDSIATATAREFVHDAYSPLRVALPR